MKTALVLSGGGAKGAFQAGALQALDDRNVAYQCVAGVSVGALNGVMAASNQIDRMVNIWETVDQDDVYNKRSLPLIALQYLAHKIGIWSPPKSIYSNEPLYKLLKKELGNVELQIPLTIGRVNLESGNYINAIQPGSTNFVQQVLASTAIPIVWEPVVIGGKNYVDGGIRNTTPLKDAIRNNPDRIIVITNGPLDVFEQKEDLDDIVDIAERSLDIMLDEIFKEDIKRCIQINKLVQQAGEKGLTLQSSSGRMLKNFELTIISPPEPLGSPLDFKRQRLNNLLEMGKRTAGDILDS